MNAAVATAGLLAIIIGVVVFLFLSLLFGGILMIIGALFLIYVFASEKKEYGTRSDLEEERLQEARYKRKPTRMLARCKIVKKPTDAFLPYLDNHAKTTVATCALFGCQLWTVKRLIGA